MEKGDLIGKGREAEIIYWGNNRVLKLFFKTFSRDWVDYQFKVNSLVEKKFPNCPKAFEKIEDNGRFAIIYEYIEGITLNEFMGKKLKNMGKSLRMLAEIHVDMHKHIIKDIHTQKNKLEYEINQTNLIDEDQKKEVIQHLEKLPDGNIICHSDFHPDNIIISKNKLFVVDWANACSGHPNGDVSRTYYIIKYGLSPSDEVFMKKSFMHRFLYRTAKGRAAKIYLNHYLKLTIISLKEIRKWDLPTFAARLREGISLENKNLQKMILKKLKKHK
ncbi:hypothetical protein LCGC14_0778110 [marine sediment metagenome]|uniref:Aminoglycoside phosphotransferase domain-containing protein n=1 Tax=marine sediment metagenome TaxID=412755 RepID=A0A0F9T3D9_9ZZZZ